MAVSGIGERGRSLVSVEGSDKGGEGCGGGIVGGWEELLLRD